MGKPYQPVIGLEVHAQLATRSKLFCACLNAFGGEPNTRVCPVCMALPGALPVTNARAVELAIAVGLALGCRIEAESTFARKNYFYPDSPRNFQITQYDEPLCRDGELDGVRIERIHLEDDAGKLIHTGEDTLVDLNRAGVPLVEIVTAPDLHTPAEAGAFLRTLRDILRYLGAGDGNMEEGSLRCDVNVSVRPRGGEPGPATEVKNLNSFRQVERALEFEIARQSALVGGGRRVERATLLWDDARNRAAVMRAKEAAEDYRYFPEPDLPPIVLDKARVEQIRAALPELRPARAARLVEAFELSRDDAETLTASRALADYYEALAAASGNAKAAAHWVTRDVLRYLGEHHVDIDAFPIPPGRLAGLVRLQADGAVNSTTAAAIFEHMLAGDADAEAIMARDGLELVTDTAEIERIAREVMRDHPDQVAAYRAGKDALIQFFVGQVMKRTGGRADPAAARSALEQALRRGDT